jgi:uncharacterized protein (TIGR00645 family)
MPKKLLSLLNQSEKFIFASRWIIAPMYYALIGALVVVVLKFAQEFWHIVREFESLDTHSMVVSVLQLVDVVLVGNLLVMIIFSGYENFVSKIEIAAHHVDRPSWMGKVDYSALKQKIIASIVAISSIELLKIFIELGTMSETTAPEHIHFFQWKLICMATMHGVFVLSGLIFAFTERQAQEEEEAASKENKQSIH